MQNVRIKSSCKVLGADRYPGAIVTVPDAVAANLFAFRRAEPVTVEEIQTREPEFETRDPEVAPPRRGRPPKIQ